MERTAPKDLTWALEYRYTNVYSPDIYTDNYTNNRISAEVIKKF